jgi:hypothetical protein
MESPWPGIKRRGVEILNMVLGRRLESRLHLVDGLINPLIIKKQKKIKSVNKGNNAKKRDNAL